MAYVRGNLAVQPKRRPQVEERYRETTKTVVRKAQLSGREKLLYLMTVVLCVTVAVVLIARYADIYSQNREVQKIISTTQTLTKEISVAEAQRQALLDWSAIEKIALEHGLVWPEKVDDIKVQKLSSGN